VCLLRLAGWGGKKPFGGTGEPRVPISLTHKNRYKRWEKSDWWRQDAHRFLWRLDGTNGRGRGRTIERKKNKIPQFCNAEKRLFSIGSRCLSVCRSVGRSVASNSRAIYYSVAVHRLVRTAVVRFGVALHARSLGRTRRHSARRNTTTKNGGGGGARRLRR